MEETRKINRKHTPEGMDIYGSPGCGGDRGGCSLQAEYTELFILEKPS